MLANDLLEVLRIEYAKARDGGGMPGGFGGYQPAQPVDYSAWYNVSCRAFGQTRRRSSPGQAQGEGTPSQPGVTPAGAGGATPAGGMPQQGTEAYQQYAAYWAAYGYDVNDPQCKSSIVQQVKPADGRTSPSMAGVAIPTTRATACCIVTSLLLLAV